MEYKAVGDQRRLQGSSVVIPAVTTGNVGQLALDLLIESSQAELAGYLDHAALLPCAGCRPFEHVRDGSPAHALEVYTTSDGITLLQQRSPVAAGCQRMFANDFVRWIGDQQFSKVWIVGGLDATYRKGPQLDDACQLRVWCGETAEAGDAAERLPRLEATWWEDQPLEQRQTPPWPLALACQRAGLPAVALLRFVAEGDNRPDAFELAGAAASVLGLRRERDAATAVVSSGALQRGQLQLRAPASWATLFGTPMFFPL